jgi:riboflavin synthase
MFTGLVEFAGITVSLTRKGKTATLTIDSGPIAQSSRMGDSIAVNGCCLTVSDLHASQITFDVGDETLARTNLGQLKTGNHVNLERALAVGDRLGGHYVTGHIDAVTELIERRDDGDWSKCWFRLPPKFAAQVVPQGSVALDGISLTVVEVQADRFSVMFVPHTLSVTTMGQRRPGESVNLETDLLAKYVEKQLAALR